MAVRICPKCDINFIRDDEKYCQICRRELKGESEKSGFTDMCSSCGEHPCEVGEDLCIFCLNERKMQDAEETVDGDLIIISNNSEIGMEEIDVPVSQDIPVTELRVIHEELGLDDDGSGDEEDEEEEITGDDDEDIMEISLDDFEEDDDDDDEEDENY